MTNCAVSGLREPYMEIALNFNDIYTVRSEPEIFSSLE